MPPRTMSYGKTACPNRDTMRTALSRVSAFGDDSADLNHDVNDSCVRMGAPRAYAYSTRDKHTDTCTRPHANTHRHHIQRSGTDIVMVIGKRCAEASDETLLLKQPRAKGQQHSHSTHTRVLLTIAQHSLHTDRKESSASKDTISY